MTDSLAARLRAGVPVPGGPDESKSAPDWRGCWFALAAQRNKECAEAADLIDKLQLERAASAQPGTVKARTRLIYNKTTKRIDKVRDGLVIESFDPPEEP